MPLVCLDHGLREPSSSKPYAIRPIENYLENAAVIEIVAAYANGDLPPGAQAAVWNLNSGVGWDELAAKLTGTERQRGARAVFQLRRDRSRNGNRRPRGNGHRRAGRRAAQFKLPEESDGDDVATETEIDAEADADEGEDAVSRDDSSSAPSDENESGDADSADEPEASAS